MLVGLTGGIGSGKTAVSDLFSKLKIDVVDADIISRQVVAKDSEALKQMASHFGTKILQDDGTLNRSVLRDLVFQDPLQKSWLEQLLHPLIREQISQAVAKSSSSYTLVVIPLLVENKTHYNFERVLVVDCDVQTQQHRVLQRDNSTLDQVEAIIGMQASRNERLAMADDIIVNDGDLLELEQKVMALHQRYTRLAKSIE